MSLTLQELINQTLVDYLNIFLQVFALQILQSHVLLDKEVNNVPKN